jgi:colicin import membrane protein
VEQAQLELQLKVWKELAISKQLLMRTAAVALKLDPDCSQDELKKGLEDALKRMAEADANVITTREQAKQQIADMEKKLATAVAAQTTAETTVVDLRAKQENLTEQLTAMRTGAATEQQKLKASLAEKEKALKAINTALNDTPENVVKKMNVLKKQRQEEADARRQVESSFTTLRKEKQQQDQKIATLQTNSGKLITQHRDLHTLALKLHEQLQPVIADAKDLPTVAELDSKLIEEIEQNGSSGKK